MINATLPDVVTHIYHRGRGAFRNLCELPRADAIRIILEMRDAGRPRLDPSYLDRRLATEEWLIREAGTLFDEPPRRRPLYAFLGSFGNLVDPSRPAFLRLPLAVLGRATFTLGDSMRVAARPDRRLLLYSDLLALAARGGLSSFAPSDSGDSPGDFIEVQLWDGIPNPMLEVA